MPHTPGPWRVGETRHKYDLLIRNRDNDPVASCYLAGYGPQTGQANARLIAAAPEMLQALQLVESVYRQNCVTEGEPSSVLAELQRVIALAHADGGEPR